MDWKRVRRIIAEEIARRKGKISMPVNAYKKEHTELEKKLDEGAKPGKGDSPKEKEAKGELKKESAKQKEEVKKTLKKVPGLKGVGEKVVK